MAELSEKDLLLLDNLMYYKGSTEKTTAGDMAEDILSYSDSELESMLQGGMTPTEARSMATEISNNSTVSSLTVAKSEESTGFRASCFVDANGDATVAVRGTGGSYEAWNDNVIAAYDVETPIQEKMRSFIEDDCAQYNDITVTGHSKGGNLAQYATIRCGDQIDRCVSYDGQGFNNEFCVKYCEEIAENSSKIKSICCESDYVNILLTSVAGETVYLNSEPGANPHSSYPLYEANKDGVNGDGEYITTVNQNPWLSAANVAADVLVMGINGMDDFLEKSLVDGLGTLVGIGFSLSSGQFDIGGIVKDLGTKFLQNVERIACPFVHYGEKISNYIQGGIKAGKLIIGGIKDIIGKDVKTLNKLISTYANVKFEIKTQKIQGPITDFDQYASTIKSLEQRLDSIKLENMLYAGTKIAIQAIKLELHIERNDMKECHDALSNIKQAYIKADTNIMAFQG